MLIKTMLGNPIVPLSGAFILAQYRTIPLPILPLPPLPPKSSKYSTVESRYLNYLKK